MSDVFEVLKQDHEQVKAMLAQLEAGPTVRSGASQDQFDERKKLTGQVIIEESRHEAVEEQYFWPAVRDQGAEGEKGPARPSARNRRPSRCWPNWTS
jgi:hypothetical protein